jgi:hypothetical protein
VGQCGSQPQRIARISRHLRNVSLYLHALPATAAQNQQERERRRRGHNVDGANRGTILLRRERQPVDIVDWGDMGQGRALVEAKEAMVNTGRCYALLCRDRPLDDGPAVLQERREALAAYVRAAVELVRIEGTQSAEE